MTEVGIGAALVMTTADGTTAAGATTGDIFVTAAEVGMIEGVLVVDVASADPVAVVVMVETGGLGVTVGLEVEVVRGRMGECSPITTRTVEG